MNSEHGTEETIEIDDRKVAMFNTSTRVKSRSFAVTLAVLQGQFEAFDTFLVDLFLHLVKHRTHAFTTRV